MSVDTQHQYAASSTEPAANFGGNINLNEQSIASRVLRNKRSDSMYSRHWQQRQRQNIDPNDNTNYSQQIPPPPPHSLPPTIDLDDNTNYNQPPPPPPPQPIDLQQVGQRGGFQILTEQREQQRQQQESGPLYDLRQRPNPRKKKKKNQKNKNKNDDQTQRRDISKLLPKRPASTPDYQQDD